MRIDVTFMRDLAYGSAVGDALGVPYEFRHRGAFKCTGMAGHGTFDQPAGTWSDDTSMTLATCESIMWNGSIVVDDIMNNFRGWLYGGAFTPFGKPFDVGTTTYKAIHQGFGMTDEWSKGNGSLMRIAPLAATDCTDEEVRAVSAITHATDLCCDLCVSFVHMLRSAHEAPERAKSIVSEETDVIGKTRPEIASGGFVQHTYDAAAWCFLNTDSYRDCVLEAVNLGEDTDTTACVAGALAAACYGFDSIPSEWVQTLQSRHQIDEAVMTYFD
jgi:ADP-ribosylglycohydrolase